MKLRLTAKIQNAGGVKEVYDYVVKGKGREEWRDEYDFVSKFLDGLAAVQLRGKWGWVDTLGREVISPIYSQIKNLDSGYRHSPKGSTWGFDHHGLCAVQLNGKWGMINRDGEEVVPLKYDEIANYWRENEAWVKLDGVYGTLKPNGKVYYKTDSGNMHQPY